ncbi:hypothetical protein [Dactylosporangium sp. NPDC048998]|uniref:hypothetical protein n=1 Tax=Dactylosporangium sp. NPDC048998 TaxID=3363976 RepID=UPI00371924BA
MAKANVRQSTVLLKQGSPMLGQRSPPLDEGAGMLVRRPPAVIAALMLAAAVVSACGGLGPGARSGASARNASPTPKVTLSAPATLGSWHQSGDQSAARSLATVLSYAGNTFAVRYEQPTKPPRTLIVLGGTGARFQPGDATIQQDAFFTALNKQLSASHPTAPRWVDGHIGGEAACASTDSFGTAYTACTWIGPGVLIAFLVQDTDFAAASREVEPLVGDFITIQ